MSFIINNGWSTKREKHQTMEKVNLHITKSGGDVDQPKITTEHFPYMGKKTYYPFPTFQVNYRYKGVLPVYKTLKQELVSETSAHLPTNIWKSSCVLTYNNLQYLTIQVSLRDNFKVKLDEIYFSYVFLMVNHIKPIRIRKALELT